MSAVMDPGRSGLPSDRLVASRDSAAGHLAGSAGHGVPSVHQRQRALAARNPCRNAQHRGSSPYAVSAMAVWAFRPPLKRIAGNENRPGSAPRLLKAVLVVSNSLPGCPNTFLPAPR